MSLSKSRQLLLVIWMIIILLMPLLVRTHHTHKNNLCKHESHSHFQTPEEICLICNFEFSVFSEVEISHQSLNIQYCEAKILQKSSDVVSIPVQYSFQHRAPPVSTN